uniref:DH domain-containing protein n=1 Tax=Esox lucius TaxID=8010 RepID=A0A3P8YFM0_ESOLU
LAIFFPCRLPKKANRSSSVLSKDHPPDKKPKSDKPAVPSSHEFDPTGLVQRCVIIQKDENGFGLTVSGDNPVFVQLVNGTLVTHSNHVEVVKLIKSGSYVALTVLGRPPGLPQIPLSEGEAELGFLGGQAGFSVTSPSSPGQTTGERPYSPLERVTSPLPIWVNDEYSRNPTPRLLKDIQEAKKHIPQLQGQLSKATGGAQVTRLACSLNQCPIFRGFALASPESMCQRDLLSCHSPKSTPRDSLNSCHSPDPEYTLDLSLSPSTVSSPSSRIVSQIIGAEDDYFDSEQEQVNGQCSCFQSIELLKSRPAHLAAFLHHVVSQFDPAPLLCYLYADLYKQTNPKETRRVFMDFHTFFIDRGAVSRVGVSQRQGAATHLLSELNRQYIQMLQDTLLTDIQRNLEDFRQKRSMGLTVAEVELTRLDTERVRDRVALERERSCAENIIAKIEEVLLTTQPTEEEKCTTMQFVILSYMKHLGVRVKEPRSLESKRVRINFLPKIKKSIKTEKEGGEEKVKRTRFPSILGPQRRPSRWAQFLSPWCFRSPVTGSLFWPPTFLNSDICHCCHIACCFTTWSYGFCLSPSLFPFDANPPGGTPNSALSRLNEVAGDLDSLPCSPNMQFDYSLDQLQEEDRESGLDALGSVEVQSEDDQGGTDSEHDPLNWQQLVGREVLAGLRPHEIKRQEVINELFYTERAHLRMLKVLDNIFYQKLTREAILPPADIKNIFTNLEDIVQLHVSISEQMAAIRKRNESSVIDQIGDDLLSWFSGGEEEKIKQAVGTFCSNQPFALELIKSRQKKDSRFTSFMQEAESNRLCRRLQLKDIIPVEMQRLTKYPLLLESIVKYTDDLAEKDKVKKAGDCCRRILNHVNQAVKESENKQRLEDYQRRLDLSSLKQTENPVISELKNLDLTKKKMVHEGPLSWKVNKDKTIELYTLLLEDILVLLQKQDERLILKCHSKNLSGTADTKHIFSPIIKLNTVLVRSVATDNKSFFVLSMSENVCLTRHITQRADAMKVKPHSVIPLPQTDGERDGVETITERVGRLGKDPERVSSGSNLSTGVSVFPRWEGSGLQRQSPRSEVWTANLRFCLKWSSALLLLVSVEGTGFTVQTHPPVLMYPPPPPPTLLSLVSALKQVLVTQLMSQEDSERAGRASSGGGRLLRTTSLRTPVDSRARVAVQNGSGRTGHACHPEDPSQDLASGDTGFFESSEDYAGYLVLEGYGGSRESSTDDDLQGKQLSASRGCGAGDSGISLRFSSTSQAGGVSGFSPQVLSYLRNLQTNLNHLKEVEAKYYSLLRQRPARSSTDTDDNKGDRALVPSLFLTLPLAPSRSECIANP